MEDSQTEKMLNKIKENYLLKSKIKLLEKWIEFERTGKKLKTFFEVNRLSKIAVYAYGKYGKMIIEDLLKDNIDVAYAIDKNISTNKDIIPIYNLDKRLPKVDAVVVSTVGIDMKEIIKALESCELTCPVFNLEDVFECQNIIGSNRINQK